MPTFAYEALNASGKPQKGTIEAGSSEEAIQKIKSQGLYPSNIKESAGAKKAGGGGADAEAAPKKKKTRRAGGSLVR